MLSTPNDGGVLMVLDQHFATLLSALAVGFLWLAPAVADAAIGATLTQDSSSVSMKYDGGCEAGEVVVCADPAPNSVGPEIGVQLGRDAVVSFQDPPASVMAAVDDGGFGSGRALSVTPTADPVAWLVRLDEAVRDGQRLRITPSYNPGSRNYIATLRIPTPALPQTAPAPKPLVGLRLTSVRLDGTSLNVSFRPTVTGDLTISAVSASGHRVSSRRVRVRPEQTRVVLNLSRSGARRVHRVEARLTSAAGKVSRTKSVKRRSDSRRR